MPRFIISVPHPYAGRVGGKGAGKDGTGKVPTQQINVEAKSLREAKTKLLDFGIPWAAANYFNGRETSKHTEDSGTKLESIAPKTFTSSTGVKTETTKGGKAVGVDTSNSGPTTSSRGLVNEPAFTGVEQGGSSGGGAGTTTGEQRDLIEQLEAIGLMEPGVIRDVRNAIGSGSAVADDGSSIGSGVVDNEFSQALFDSSEANRQADEKRRIDELLGLNDPRRVDETADPFGESTEDGAGSGMPGGFGDVAAGSVAAEAGVPEGLELPSQGAGSGGLIPQAEIDNFKSGLGIELTPRMSEILDGILKGEFTPAELGQVFQDPDFQAIFNHPTAGPLLNPAISLAVTNATEQLRIAGGINQADAGASNAGALLRSGGTVDDILKSIRIGATGLSNDDDVLTSQRINSSGGFDDEQQMLANMRIQSSGGFDDENNMLKQQRIAASGGLDNNSNILAMQEAMAANNAFGSLQLGDGDGEAGSKLANILAIIKAEQGGQTGANQVAREGQWMNFMGNPAALGAATAAGFDPLAQMKAALQSESDSPQGNVSIESAMKALETQPDTGLKATSGIGSIGGLERNFTEGQYDNSSNMTKQNVSGQLAASQGLGADEIQKRARSFTPSESSYKRSFDL